MKNICKSKWFPSIVFGFSMFMFGFEIGSYNFTIDYMVKEFGLSGTGKGVIVALEFAAMVVSPLLFAKLANKMDKRLFLLVFGSVFLSGALIVVLQSNLILLGTGMVLIGAGFSLMISVIIALMMDVYPRSNSKVNTLCQAMFSIGAVVSPLIGGVLINSAGTNWRISFIIIICIAVVDLFVIKLVDLSPKETPLETHPKTKGLFPYFLVITICLIAMLYVGTEDGVSAFLGSYMKEDLSSSVFLSGLSISLFWVMMIPSRFIVSLLYKHKNEILFICLSVVIISLFLLSSANTYKEGLVYVVLIGFFCGPIYPLLSSYITEISNGNTVKASIYLTAFGGLGGAIATFSMGAISDVIGELKYSFIMVTLLMFIALILYFVFQLKIRKDSKLK